MPSRLDIEDVLFDGIFAAISSLVPGEERLVWADYPRSDSEPPPDPNSAPQPDVPYMTLKIIAGLQRIGNIDSYSMPPQESPSIAATVLGQRRFTLSVQAFGSSASDLIQAILDHLQKPSVGGYFRRTQKTTIEVSTVTPSADYEIVIGDQFVSINSGPTPTATTIRDALVSAIDALVGLTATNGTNPDDLIVETLPGITAPVELDGKTTISEDVAAVDIAFLSDTGELDISELLDGNVWEKRSAIDLFFGTDATITDADVGVIETVEFDEVING